MKDQTVKQQQWTRIDRLVRKIAHRKFCHLPLCQREDAVAEVVALAWQRFSQMEIPDVDVGRMGCYLAVKCSQSVRHGAKLVRTSGKGRPCLDGRPRDARRTPKHLPSETADQLTVGRLADAGSDPAQMAIARVDCELFAAQLPERAYQLLRLRLLGWGFEECASKVGWGRWVARHATAALRAHWLAFQGGGQGDVASQDAPAW